MTPWGKPPDDVLIEGRFQFRFLLRLSLLLAVGTFFLYLALLSVFSRKLAGDFPSVFYSLRQFAEFLLPIIAIAVLAYVLLLGGAAVVLFVIALHKVAGPLYRMEKAFEEYVAGDPVKPVFFRQGDQAHPLARDFNRFVARIREDRSRWMGIMDHADRLCLQDQTTCRGEMEAALAELESQTSKYH